MSIQRLDNLIKKFDRLSEVPASIIRLSVGREILGVADAAKLGAPGYTGELRNSIHTATEIFDDGVRGICFTSKKYAPYVELGTGPVGEQFHAGISPAISPAYTQEAWWIHESQIDREDAERYRWPYIDTEDGRFYKCSGQAAQPFMYPALKNREEAIVKNIGSDIKKGVTKV